MHTRLTKIQAAALLGVPEAVVDKLIREGDLPVLNELTYAEFSIPFVSYRHVTELRQRMIRVTRP
jgi:hypothetical protein